MDAPGDSKAIVWSFFGNVVPDAPAITLLVPRHGWTSTLGFEVELEARIWSSKIMATVYQLSPVDLLTLRNDVARDLRAYVDLACLLVGAGLDVILTSAQASDGSWQFFDAFIPALQNEGPFEISPELLTAVTVDGALQRSLSDFREAMRVPPQTGFFCYRAVESQMQTFRLTATSSERDAWGRYREALQVSREALDRIKLHADWARHGRQGQITGAERAELLVTTRAILQRYVDYRLNDSRPLSPDLFPLIT